MQYCKKRVTVIFLALLASVSIYADITDTVHAIRAIEIQGARLQQFHTGASIHEIDSSVIERYSSESIATLLAEQSLASVNGYGPGGPASLSIRGGGAHHTSVIWNNINIQSPMNGGVNFSTLPAGFIDRAFIQYGGASTIYGSGTATGSLHLQESLSLQSELNIGVSAQAGSAGNFHQAGKIGIGKKKIASSFKYFLQSNKNDFRFQNTDKYNAPYEKLEHSAYKQYGISQSNKIILGSRSWIGTTIWWLDYYKEIPALMNDYSESEAEMRDKNLMYSVYYKYANASFQVKVQSGGFYNQNRYFDPAPLDAIQNNNHSFSQINIVEFTYKLPYNFEFGVILEHKFENGYSEAYQDKSARKITSGIASAAYSNSRISTVLTVREDLVDGNFIPLVFSAGFDLSLTHQFNFKGQLSKNYSLPTFNDLYWFSDSYSTGNPNLKPESGWSGEAGIYYKHSTQNQRLDFSLVYFSNQISNWIRWIQDSTMVWSPKNIQEASSNGIEVNASYSHGFGKFNFRIITRYAYTRAIVHKVEDVVIQSGTQMWYVPKNQAFAGLELRYRFIQGGYNHSLVGERTYDNAGGSLPWYTLGNIFLNFSFPVSEQNLELFLKLNNVWNTVYQARKSYAMPLNQYQIGIKLNIH